MSASRGGPRYAVLAGRLIGAVGGLAEHRSAVRRIAAALAAFETAREECGCSGTVKPCLRCELAVELADEVKEAIRGLT